MHKLLATLLLTAGTFSQVLGADHPVVIGGPGILKFTPPFVVRLKCIYFREAVLMMVLIIERCCRRHYYFHVQAEKPYCDSVNIRESLFAHAGWFRLGIVSIPYSR